MPFDKRGWEIPDPVPFATTVPMQRPPTLEETIARLVRQEVSKRAAAEGFETFEEADDFVIGDEDPRSIHELDDDQEWAQLPVPESGIDQAPPAPVPADGPPASGSAGGSAPQGQDRPEVLRPAQ